jgi:N-acetylglucosaminyl-diphospho-decaprenol L-rhamnosyltransferase
VPFDAARISVVVVSYNARDLLEECLVNVVRSADDVIVVDNASADGSPGMVRDRFPTVRLIELHENRGFGTAANEGIRSASGRYVLLLNPDAWPLPGAVDALFKCGEAGDRIGVVGPRLVDPNGNPQPDRLGYPTAWSTGAPAVTSQPRSLHRALVGAAARTRRVPLRRTGAKPFFSPGAALLLRRDAFDVVGGFDTDFFMFYEELDLAWRMWQAGWRTRFCGPATFIHVGGASTRPAWTRMYREQLRSHLRFLAKHEGVGRAEWARRLLVVAVAARTALARGEHRAAYRLAAQWLRSRQASALIGGYADSGPPPG